MNTKMYNVGDKSKALCENCGVTTTTFFYRDIPMSDTQEIIENILVGVCDNCESVVSIPAQSSGDILRQRENSIR